MHMLASSRLRMCNNLNQIISYVILIIIIEKKCTSRLYYDHIYHYSGKMCDKSLT